MIQTVNKMKITCAISPSQIQNLYKHAYAKMYKALQQKEDFNAEAYMRDLFEKIAKTKDEATAAKFLQQVPSVLGTLALNSKLIDLDVKVDPLRALIKKFKNEENGIVDTIKYFRPEVSQETLDYLVNEKKNESTQQQLTESDPETQTRPRLKPYSAYTSTFQELLALNPKLIEEFTSEVVDESKTRIYKALKAIREENGDSETIMDDLTYQGKTLRLKATKLMSLDQTKLDEYTRKLISRSVGMLAKGKAQANVTQAKDIVALVISDIDGNELYFDKEGNITTKENGALVYQFLRDIRLEGDQYVVTNIYGYPVDIMSVERIAKAENISLEKAAEIQQKSFKKIYNFKNKVLAGKLSDKEALLPLVGVSEGLPETVSNLNLSFKYLDRLPIVTRATYQTIDVAKVDTADIPEGRAYMTINGQNYQVDRAFMTDDLINKIATVLTNPNLSSEERYYYAAQFIYNNLPQSTQRHKLYYNPANGDITFQYNPLTSQERLKNKLQSVDDQLYLKDSELKNKTPEELAEMKQTIIDVLTTASHNKEITKAYSARVNFNNNLIQSGVYTDYDVATGEFVYGQDYIQFFIDMPETFSAKVTSTSGLSSGFYNSYMYFKLPSKFTETVEKAKKEVTETDNRSVIRRLKDATVNYLLTTDDKAVEAQVTFADRGITPDGKPYAYFIFRSFTPGFEGISVRIYLDPKLKKDITKLPMAGDNVILQVEDVGIALPVVAAYNSNYERIGQMQETDYDAGEAPRDYSKLAKEKIAEAETKETINPTDVPSPSEGGSISKRFFLRSAELPNNVTEEQIQAAKEWWESSPLAKIISIEHVANIVNSNAYARFVIAAKTLDSAKIQINAAKGGNYVDVYHEAWHVFSQLFLTPREKTKLYDEVRKSNPKYKDYSFLQLEEVIAEDFRTYALKEKTKKDQPVRNSLFRKILNFIKKFLGLISRKDILFQNLYFANNNPSLLNNYTPLIDNAMFDLLNRGPEVIGMPNKQALNEQDGLTVVASMDSVISDIVDDVYDDAKIRAVEEEDNALQSKSGTLKLVTDERNKKELYVVVRERFEEKLKSYQKDLLEKKKERGVTTKSFDELTTEENLNDNAVAVIKKADGKKIYAFLSSQVDSFNNLINDFSKVRGQVINGALILNDFYTHADITNEDESPVEIMIALTPEDIVNQYAEFDKADLAVDDLIENEIPEAKPLTSEAQALVDKVRILQHAIKNWGDENNGIVKYHMENSRYDIIRSEDYEADDENDTINEDLSKSERQGNKPFGADTVEDMAGKETRYILSSLHEINKLTGKHVIDSLGFKKLADARTVWSRTISAIAGIKNPIKQIEELKAQSEVFPEFKQLIDYKLPDPNNPKNAYENSTTTGFYQDFGRLTKYPVLQLTYFAEDPDAGTPERMEVVTASVNTSSVLSNWRTLFQSEVSDYVMKNEDNQSVLKLNTIIDKFKDADAAKQGKIQLDVKKSFEFARAIGLFLDPSSKNIMDKELTLNQKKIEYYGLPYMFKTINTLAKIELSKPDVQIKSYIYDFKTNPLKYLYTKVPAEIPEIGGESQRTTVDRLIQLQLKYGSQDASNQVYNAEGNLINQHAKDHSISMKVYALNNAKKLSDLWTTDEFGYMSSFNPAINPFTNRLSIFKNLFTAGAERLRASNRMLELFLNSGFQINTQIGSGVTNLDVHSKFLYEFHTMMKAGIKEFIRAASKSSSFGVRILGGIMDPTLGGKKNDPHLWIDIDRFGKGTGEQYAFQQHLLEYIAGEYDRIRKFKANPEEFKKYKGYNRVVGKTKSGEDIYSGESFIAFNDVLRGPTKKKILDKVGDQDLVQYLKTDADLYKDIYNDVINYFNRQTIENLDILSEAEYIEPALYDKVKVFATNSFDQKYLLMKAYTYNSWIQNFETVIIFQGDPAETNHKKEEEHKRNTGAQSNGPGFRSDVGIRKYINSTVRATSYAASKGEEFDKFTFSNKLNTAILQDVLRDSVYYKEILEGLREDYRERLKDIDIPNKEELINKKAEKEAGKYLNMEEGDGQGWITFDAYRALKIAENDWDWNDQERLFQKVVKGEKIEKEDVKKFFPPYKVQYHGPLGNGQENIVSGKPSSLQLPVTAMHKFELGVLIPSMIKGMELEKLHNQMMKKNIQYVTFGTGSKKGAITSDGSYDQVFEEGSDQSIIKSDINFTNNIIYLDLLKKVTNVPSKFKTRTIFPTQQRVLTYDGLFNQGEIINPTEERVKVIKAYKDTVDGFSEILQEKLLQEIGGEKLADGSYKINNMLKLMKIVDRELKRRNLPEHLRKYIGVNPDKTAKIDLSFHPSADEIEGVITSLVEKRLIKQKVKGEGFIQIASPMTNGGWDSELKIKADTPEKVREIRGSNTLPFYRRGKDGNTLAMKVAITLQGDYFNLLNGTYKGEVIGTIERLNQAIKDEEWLDIDGGRNRQAITMTGVRIPTDSKSQMDFMEIYEFLDPASGNVIILPTEMVAKSGTDYDGDKLTTSTAHISKKGNFIRRKRSTEELMSEIAKLKKKGKINEANALIELQTKVLENELIQSTRDILALKDNYANLVRPNMTDTLEDFADEIQQYTSEYNRFKRVHGQETTEITPTKIFEEGYNLHKHQVNLDSARPLGITAVDNKQGPLHNSIGSKLPASYKGQLWNDELNRYVDLDSINYLMRVFFPTNKMNVNGVEHISMSNESTVDGMNSISILKSMLLNGFLDVEKKPWAYYIGGNEVTTPLLLDLMSMGVPYKNAILLVVNPMVREYVKQLNLIRSKFAPLIGTAVDSPSFNYYEAALRTLQVFGMDTDENRYGISNRNYYNHMTKIASQPGILNEDKQFDLNRMMDVLIHPKDPKNQQLMLAMFLHYLELEKELKGHRAFKFQLNPDTTTSKTPQEIQRREIAFLGLSDMSKVDQETVRKAREESLLSSFFVGRLTLDIIKPLFSFRNDDRVSDYLFKVLTDQRQRIINKYGGKREDISKFITDYKNAVVTSLFQSSFGNQYYDFINFQKGSIEPELRSISFEDMTGKDPDSFNYQFMQTIKAFITPSIKAKYPVIEKIQLKELRRKSGIYGLTLSNSKSVRKNESGLADIYYQNLLELSNPQITKVSDPDLNMHISNMFYLMMLVNTYMNGLGYSSFGIIKAVPYDNILNMLQEVSFDYTDDKFNNPEFFENVLDVLLSETPAKDYMLPVPYTGPEMSVTVTIPGQDPGLVEPNDESLNIKDEDTETGVVLGSLTFGAQPKPTARPFVQVNERIRKEYPNEITEGNNRLSSRLLIDLANLKLGNNVFVQPEESTKEYWEDVEKVFGEPAGDYVDFSSIEITYEEGNFLKNNPIFAKALVDAYKKDWEARDDYQSYDLQQFAQMLLDKNEIIVDTYQLSLFDTESTVPVTQAPVSTKFQGYKGGFENVGKGTPQGDGKDKAMRQVADSFVVEVSSTNPSSSLTSLKTGSIIEQKGTKEQTVARSTKNMADPGEVVMLARNGSLKGKPLLQETKDMIKFYHDNFNMEFVVGDMPEVDSQFIDYLQEIGAKFTIYHTGNTSRIQITQPSTPINEPTVSTTNNPAEYTNHSGGAYGGDTFWDVIGREFGVTDHKHYREASNVSLSAQLRNAGVKAEVLSKEQMDKARAEVEKLLGEKYPDTIQGNLKVRNYYQVANADAVYAIADMNWQYKSVAERTAGADMSLAKSVKGGTDVAVQLGIALNKPTYVWDIQSKQWYKWDSAKKEFVETETPTLTKNFAGVGSRDIESYNIKDKDTGEWKAREQYKGKAIEEAAKQAIRDVYENTFDKPKTIPEIIAEGTSPYRGRFTVKQMYDSTVFVESDIKLTEAISKALDTTTSPEYKGILKSYFYLIDKNILQRNIFLSRDRYKEGSSGTLGISAAIEFVGIRREIDGEGKLSERQIQTMVHELTHMLTLQPFIKENDRVELTAKESEFLKEIKSLYLYVKSLESSENMDFSNAMSNEFEFIADAIADPKFRAYLNTIKYDKGKSVLSKLIEIIKKLLGVKSGTALETIVDQVYSLREDVNYKHYDTLKHLVDEMRIIETKDNLKKLTSVTPVANIPQNKVSGIESFGSLVTANAEAIKALGPNPHSIDMIEAGFRTRTTRSESEMAKYAIKVGDVIKHFGKSADGSTKNILARVTAIHPKGSPGWKGTWNKEGWSAKDVDVIDRFKDGAAAIEFEVIQPTQPSVSTNVQVISPDYGVVKVETNPTKANTQAIIDLIAPQIEKQAYKENVGGNANWQFSFGNMWSRVNLKAKPLVIDSFAGVSKTKAQIEALKKEGKNTDKTKFIYDYHELDQDGNPLPSLSELQPLIDKIQNALGIDMSDYDSMLGNIYLDNQSIAPHRDTTEAKSAEGYPVIVYTIGNDSGLGIWDDNKGKITFQGTYKQDYQGRNPTNEIPTKDGTIYTFGMEGKGRFALSHTTPLGNIKKNPFPPIKLSDGRVITNYTITLTFRRAADLESGMPAAPAKLSTQPTVQPVGKAKEGVAELFKSNPELASVGTPEQYSQYLDTIFPESQVKDIVYHGGNLKNLTKRDRPTFFTRLVDYARKYTGISDKPMPAFIDKEGSKYQIKSVEKIDENKYIITTITDKQIEVSEYASYYLEDPLHGTKVGYKPISDYNKNKESAVDFLFAAILNIKNPKYLNKVSFQVFDDIKESIKGYDSIIGEEAKDLVKRGANKFVAEGESIGVLKPEQIHILGSKQDIEGFKNFVSKVSTTGIEATKRLFQEAVIEPILINQTDIARFNSVVEKSNGLKPKEFYTSDADFDAFNYPEEVRTQEDPTASKWLLNSNGLYDLVDQFTDEIYLRDVDLATGKQKLQAEDTTPVNEKDKRSFIKSLRDGVADYRIDEILAERGYDINEIIDNLEAATTQQEYSKIVTDVLKNIC